MLPLNAGLDPEILEGGGGGSREKWVPGYYLLIFAQVLHGNKTFKWKVDQPIEHSLWIHYPKAWNWGRILRKALGRYASITSWQKFFKPIFLDDIVYLFNKIPNVINLDLFVSDKVYYTVHNIIVRNFMERQHNSLPS